VTINPDQPQLSAQTAEIVDHLRTLVGADLGDKIEDACRRMEAQHGPLQWGAP
jgi:hypothetical protein